MLHMIQSCIMNVRLEIETSDTRELDLGETEAFELDETTMDQKEAGVAIEPFNMKQVVAAARLPCQKNRFTCI